MRATLYVWLGRLWTWLEDFGKRAWILILIVSLISLGFVIANYRLTKSAQRPNLVSASPSVNLSTRPETVIIDWGNFGTKAARRGTATLYTLNSDNTHREEIGTAPIIGAGTNVLPTFNGRAQFNFDMQKFLGHFLACARYFDDDGTAYDQAYLFGAGQRQQGFLPLNELSPPDVSACLR